MNKVLDTLKSAFGKVKEIYKKYSEIITPTLVLSIICIVITLALSSTNKLTKDRIDAIAEQNKKEAMTNLVDADDFPEVTDTFTLNGEEVEITYNLAVKDEKTVAYIFTLSEKGYGGDVSVMTAVKPDNTVLAVNILDASNESPGYGKDVTKEVFYSQYNGLSGNITVIRDGSGEASKNEVNTISGATLSTNAVTKAVNNSIECAKQITEEGDVK